MGVPMGHSRFLGSTTPLPENRSEHISSILPNYWDRISCQHNGVGCRLRKLG